MAEDRNNPASSDRPEFTGQAQPEGARPAGRDSAGPIPVEIMRQVKKQVENGGDITDVSVSISDDLARKMLQRATLSPDEQIEIHSTEVQEILGYVPRWIIRWGITTILAVLALLLLGSWVIEYPDVIVAPITITSTHPPAYVKARSNGIVRHLLVADEDPVLTDQYLAVLETTADFREVRNLEAQLVGLQEARGDSLGEYLSNHQVETGILLGELQSDYEVFVNSVADYRNFIDEGYYNLRTDALRDQIARTELYRDQLEAQRDILHQEYTLAEQQHTRNQELFDGGLVSSTDLENSQTIVFQKKFAVKSADISITNAQIQLSQLEQNLLDLQHDETESERRLRTAVTQACDNLRSKILIWEQKYVVKAPFDGTVCLTRYWVENQNVQIGDNVLAVAPDEVTRIVGRIELSLKGSGKVLPGQIVNVKLLDFPHEEFGIVQGAIESKSQIPDQDAYIVTVDFPDGLVTNYGDSLAFAQEMRGLAEVVTEDMRLLERIFDQVRSQLH